MKKIFIAGMLLVSALIAKAQNEISVKVQGASLQTLFTTIQQKSDYVFFYNDDLLSSAKKVSLNQYATVPEILDTALSNTGLTYTIIDKQIVIKKSKKILPVKQQQEYEVTGIVTDKSGNPLVGVNVLIKGKQSWDITREKGDYRIAVTASDSLRFEYLGYKTKRVGG